MTDEKETRSWKEFDERYPTLDAKRKAQIDAIILENRATNQNDEKVAVVEGMTRYGGGFVKALGGALIQADPENIQKIKDTWPEYWAKYLEIGKEILSRSL